MAKGEAVLDTGGWNHFCDLVACACYRASQDVEAVSAHSLCGCSKGNY